MINILVDCKYSNWTEWSECSVTAGNGVEVRYRTENPSAAYGGRACVGDKNQTQPCYIEFCKLFFIVITNSKNPFLLLK